MPTTPAPEAPAVAPKVKATKVKGKADKATPTATTNGKPARPAAKAETATKPGADRDRLVREASLLLKAASDATRLNVLLMLRDGPRNVGPLCTELGQSQPAVSHHIAIMRHSRLLECKRMGKENHYSLTDSGRRLVECVRGLVGTEV